MRTKKVCRCPAYKFPHRILGGKCVGGEENDEQRRDRERDEYLAMSWRQRREHARFLRSEYN